MSVVQHAALHVQGQHIIWHRVFMDLKDTFTAAPCQRVGLAKDQMHLTQKSNPWQPRMITLHYGFAAAGAGPISVAVLIESSLGQPLSR